jgi:membrane protein YdbS with pleckstrin-like domain
MRLIRKELESMPIWRRALYCTLLLTAINIIHISYFLSVDLFKIKHSIATIVFIFFVDLGIIQKALEHTRKYAVK